MIITETAQTTEDLNEVLDALYIMTKVMTRRITRLQGKLEGYRVEYNPFSTRSLGYLTRDLNDIAQIGERIGIVAQKL